MRNKFLVFGIFCIVSVNLYAQSDSLLQNSDMQRHRFKLAMGTTILEKDQLQTMLSSLQFSNYNHTRLCYIASIPLLSVAGYYTACGSIFLGLGWRGETLGEGLLVVMSYACFGYAFACLVPGVTLIVHSAKKMNNIVDDYNKHRQSSYFQNGLQLNYGFVGNGIGLSLRF